MKSEYKLIILGLAFEYAIFQPLWSKYITGHISYDDVNLFGITALTGISLFFIGIVFYFLNKHYYSESALVKMFFSSLISLILISYVSYEIDLNKTHKIEPIGFETHNLFFSGIWLKDEFVEDYNICLKQNFNFYQCFEGLETSPWLFPNFYKNLQFVNITLIISFIFVVVYVGSCLLKNRLIPPTTTY